MDCKAAAAQPAGSVANVGGGGRAGRRDCERNELQHEQRRRARNGGRRAGGAAARVRGGSKHPTSARLGYGLVTPTCTGHRDYAMLPSDSSSGVPDLNSRLVDDLTLVADAVGLPRNSRTSLKSGKLSAMKSEVHRRRASSSGGATTRGRGGCRVQSGSGPLHACPRQRTHPQPWPPRPDSSAERRPSSAARERKRASAPVPYDQSRRALVGWSQVCRYARSCAQPAYAP